MTTANPEIASPKLASPKLVCRDVWKIFGAGASELLRSSGGNPSSEELARHHLVGAVRHVDLEVREGENFVIMGLSGSGKSTLVRCLSRLIEPTSGEILFNGEDLLTASDARMIEIRRHRMGMVFQHFALLPHLTVLANVAFPLEVQGIRREEREARARRMIELVGLSGKEGFFPRELSGGQQQRVGIARSLAVEPELWFLDEPFSALDPLIRREMQDEFMRLQSVLKKTIVFITHDFDEAIRLADRIAIMKDGAIVQADTPENIVMAPATDYVAEFTRNVPKAKVIRVASVMKPAGKRLPTNAGETAVSAGQAIADVAIRFADGAQVLRVENAQAETVGALHRNDVIDIMMRG
ncbi:MAG: betaine/proline/choline family ABC transporter ATP-binding protein [Nitratireductor sp.]|nr:betaine/proline/choline family ABC transporter ATP-binding protein [Nitratireductor sp.]